MKMYNISYVLKEGSKVRDSVSVALRSLAHLAN
jgi:hypothetical protein